MSIDNVEKFGVYVTGMGIDVSKMGRVVRAKRGPKLPMVLAEDEERHLFENVKSA